MTPPIPGDPIVCFSRLDLEEVAAQRPPGYLAACYTAAVEVEPYALRMRRSDYESIRARFGNGRPPALPWGPPPPGLGDRVHLALAPLVAWLDRWLGTSFGTCRACQVRRAWLNRAGRELRTLAVLLVARLRGALSRGQS